MLSTQYMYITSSVHSTCALHAQYTVHVHYMLSTQYMYITCSVQYSTVHYRQSHVHVIVHINRLPAVHSLHV